MSLQEQRQLGVLRLQVLDPPLDVAQLVGPACLAVRAMFALVRVIQSGPAEASLIVCEDRDALGGVFSVRPFVPPEVLREAVYEEEYCARRRRRIGAGVELGTVMPRKPSLGERPRSR